jgi:hypothetical protein
LSLPNKRNEKYFPSLSVSSLDWDPFVLSAFESAEFTPAEEDELTEIRNGRSLKVKHSSTGMASLWFSLQQEYSIITKKTTEALHPSSTTYLCEASLSDEAQEQVATSNTGGGLEGMLLNYPNSDKGHFETSPSTGFQLIFTCLYKAFIFLLKYIIKKSYPLFTD